MLVDSSSEGYCSDDNSNGNSFTNPSTVPDTKDSSRLHAEWQPSTSENKVVEEVIELSYDKTQPGGLAFRIIGNRNNGIYVDHVDEKSNQSSLIRPGDRIVQCNERKLSGITQEQAAAILRFSISRNDRIQVRVARNENGPELISRRRSMVSLAQEEEENWRMGNQVTDLSLLRGSNSFSTFDYITSKKRVYRVVPSKSAAYIRQQDQCDETEPLTADTPDDDAYPKPRLPKSFYSFDTFEERSICPVCSRETKMLSLHLITHRCIESARRMMPYSKSEGAFPSTSYTPL